MLKQNVFVVSGRMITDGVPRGEVKTYIVCGDTEMLVKTYLAESFPQFYLITITSLLVLEDRVNKVRSVLSGKDQSWPILIDPNMGSNN